MPTCQLLWDKLREVRHIGWLEPLQQLWPRIAIADVEKYTRDHLTMSSNRKSPSTEDFDPAEWVSQAEAAAIRGVTRQAIADLLRKGRFKTLSIGGKTLLKRTEVEEFRPKPPGPAPKTKLSKRHKRT